LKWKQTILLIVILCLFLLPITKGNWLDEVTEGRTPVYISQFLDITGNGTGNFNAIEDYSAGEEFFIQPPTDKVYRISRMIITVGDTGITNADEYGALAARDTGLRFFIEQNGTRIRIDGGRNITQNGMFHSLMFDFGCDSSSLGAGTDYCAARWTFGKSGTYIRLDGNTSDKLIVMLNDSYVGLDFHYFKINGYEELPLNKTVDVAQNIQEANSMIGIAILLIGFLFFLAYATTLISTRDDNNSLIPMNTFFKLILLAMTLFVAFLTVQTMLGMSLAQNISQIVTSNLEVLYLLTTYIYMLVGFLILIALIVMAIQSLNFKFGKQNE